MTISVKCTMEIDVDRGVLYVHVNRSHGVITPLRICRLRFPPGYDPAKHQVDITLTTDTLISYGA